MPASFHLTQCPPDSSTILQMAGFPFLQLNAFHFIYILHLLFYSSVDGCLDCFHSLAITNSRTTINMGVQMSSTDWLHFLPMYAPQWDFWIIWRCSPGTTTLFSIKQILIYLSTNSLKSYCLWVLWSVPFLHILTSICTFCLLRTISSILDTLAKSSFLGPYVQAS